MTWATCAQEQELNKVLVESKTPVKDQTTTANDSLPVEEQRLWERQAEDNLADRMEKLGVLSPGATWTRCSRRW